MARGWYGSKEAHRAAALKGWITRKRKTLDTRKKEAFKAQQEANSYLQTLSGNQKNFALEYSRYKLNGKQSPTVKGITRQEAKQIRRKLSPLFKRAMQYTRAERNVSIDEAIAALSQERKKRP